MTDATELTANPRRRLSTAERMALAPRRAIAKGEAAARKLQARIQRARESGDTRKAAFLSKLLISSAGPKIATIAEVGRKQRHWRDRRAIKPGEAVQTGLSLSLADEPDEEVRAYPKMKSKGGFRPIHVFGIRDHARQRLFCKAAEHVARIDTRQFAVKNGGRPAACRAVMGHLTAGAKWAVEIDIKDFFQRIRLDWALCRFGPTFGEHVVRAVLRPDESRVRLMGYGDASSYKPTILALQLQARRGMPQGSAASALVAEAIVADVLSEMPDDARIVVYADNILLMADKRRELVRLASVLGAAFERHPAGIFEFNNSGIRRAADGFDFLGYNFHVYRGEPHAEPSKKSMKGFGVRVSGLVRTITSGRRGAVTNLSRFCRGWANAFSLWLRAWPAVDSAIKWLGIVQRDDRVRRLIWRCSPLMSLGGQRVHPAAR